MSVARHPDLRRGTINTLSRAALLIYRLERLSADSPWAHRAGGLKVALLRQIDALQRGEPAPLLDALLEECHALLSAAAREIPPGSPDD
ncbi:MAG: hypothetical protein D6755_03010 [Anaerolineae bacterium]|nr:MAG: hypothetical protein D6755_03010 [Anaerolineae bacterium]